VQPTQKELKSLDLPNNSHVPPNWPGTSVANQEEVQPDDVSGFEEFSSKPPEQLLRSALMFLPQDPSHPPREERLHIQQRIMCQRQHQTCKRINHLKL